MKNTSKWRLVIGGVVGAIAISSTATAGETVNDTVVVNLTNNLASGALGAARYSADTEQYIGCQTVVSGTGAPQTTCWAQDAAGVNYLSCTTSNASMVALARAINATSLIVFGTDIHGNCSALVVSDSSMTLH